MPTAKKKKKTSTRKTTRKQAVPVSPARGMEVKIAHLSDQMNALLVVFAVGMMFLAYILYSTYAR